MNKAYPKYKPSGVEWLGDMPEHWEVKKLKFISSIRYGIGEPPEYVDNGVPLIRATNVNAGKIETLNLVKVNPKDIPYSRIVWLKPDDIIVVRSGAYTGDSSIIPEEYAGAIAGFDMVLSCTKSHSKFIAFGLLSKYLKDGQIYLQKLRAAQPHLNAEELGECLVILPPLPEQQTIAAFLDHETGRIDALIAKKQRLLELLAEQRTALISRAVTKGLDATAKLKPSGVEWLGDVPEHWEVKKLKYVANLFGRIGFRGYTTDDLVDEGEGAITLSPSNMKDGKLHLEKSTYISWKKHYESPEIIIKKEDIVIVKTGSTFGKISYVRKVDHPITLNPQLAVFKKLKCNSRFFFYYVGAPYIQDQISLSNTGSTIPTMTQQIIMSYAIPLPPLPEQQAIAAFLDRETARIDTLSVKVTTVIERLKEYRMALISSAVTGKIDVREAV